MAQRDKTTIKVRPSVLEPLRQLRAAVERDFGIPSTQEDMVGALITGATAPQAAGMLQAYNRHTAQAAEDDTTVAEGGEAE
jgi:hypothetical protein